MPGRTDRPGLHRMKLWDPHFHLWDISPETTTGHDASQLFAVDGDPVYDRRRYESDLAIEGFDLTGGALVEAVSVCHIEEDGPRYAEACVAEARWVSERLASSPLDYIVVASAPLEDPNLPTILGDLADCAKLRGIRQILNHEPSWPRNERRGDFLDQPAWQEGFARLEEFSLSFDLQLNPHQFRKAARLLARHPGIPIVIGHLGSPTLDDLREGAVYWDGLAALADPRAGISQDIDALLPRRRMGPQFAGARIGAPGPGAIRHPTVHVRFELPGRETRRLTADRLYAAFREVGSHLDAADQQRLFAATARRAYRVPATT